MSQFKDKQELVGSVVNDIIEPPDKAFTKSISFYKEDEDDLEFIKEMSPHQLNDSKAERFARKLARKAIEEAGFQQTWNYAYPDKENETEE